tara:strand:+ start:5759 stop:6373 length:615 start_codon:yes stop_codon:yes gene_type:complete
LHVVTALAAAQAHVRERKVPAVRGFLHPALVPVIVVHRRGRGGAAVPARAPLAIRGRAEPAVARVEQTAVASAAVVVSYPAAALGHVPNPALHPQKLVAAPGGVSPGAAAAVVAAAVAAKRGAAPRAFPAHQRLPRPVRAPSAPVVVAAVRGEGEPRASVVRAAAAAQAPAAAAAAGARRAELAGPVCANRNRERVRHPRVEVP